MINLGFDELEFICEVEELTEEQLRDVIFVVCLAVCNRETAKGINDLFGTELPIKILAMIDAYFIEQYFNGKGTVQHLITVVSSIAMDKNENGN